MWRYNSEPALRPFRRGYTKGDPGQWWRAHSPAKRAGTLTRGKGGGRTRPVKEKSGRAGDKVSKGLGVAHLQPKCPRKPEKPTRHPIWEALLKLIPEAEAALMLRDDIAMPPGLGDADIELDNEVW
eukprot:5423355-Amphidinium_carterae.1